MPYLSVVIRKLIYLGLACDADEAARAMRHGTHGSINKSRKHGFADTDPATWLKGRLERTCRQRRLCYETCAWKCQAGQHGILSLSLYHQIFIADHWLAIASVAVWMIYTFVVLFHSRIVPCGTYLFLLSYKRDHLSRYLFRSLAAKFKSRHSSSFEVRHQSSQFKSCPLHNDFTLSHSSCIATWRDK